MRVKKYHTSGDYMLYAYDGQMPIEEFTYHGIWPYSYLKVIRYGFGARGIDRIERVDSSSNVTTGYPIYDAHGNMVASLFKSSTAGTYSIGDQRSYDAWGGIMSGNTSGEPRGTYCANLGHVQDDETGLVYMRARYYEPGAGRFVSEDGRGQGRNWFAYALNDPITRCDFNGHEAGESLRIIEQMYRMESFLPSFTISSVTNLQAWPT